jgi:hypothetical protein
MKRVKYPFKGELLTAAGIARRGGLSIATIQKRIAHGLSDDVLIAPAGTLPRLKPPAANAEGPRRPATVPEARQRLGRAEAHHARAQQRLLSAIAIGERSGIVERLRLAASRAGANRLYWREQVTQAEMRAGLRAPERPQLGRKPRGWVPKEERELSE